MFKVIYSIYSLVFARVKFVRFNKFLYNISLRGLGIFNYESYKISGEQWFVNCHLRAMKSGVVIDVGANLGEYSKLVRKSNKNVDIYAFEPHPKTYGRLLKNLAEAGVKTYNLAVGAKAGSLKLYDYADEDGSSHASLHKGVFEHIHKKNYDAHFVTIVSLDDFILKNNINIISLLKIDTEGHELEVLKGLVENINNNRVEIIQFEFNEMNIMSKVSFKDFWDLLPNYDFFRMLQDGLVPLKGYSPVLCEIYAYQNIVAKLKPEFCKK